MRVMRMMAFLAFFAAWLVTGSEARIETATVMAVQTVGECSDIYPEECSENSSCNDGNCDGDGPGGFSTECTPEVLSCQELFPDWCWDMFNVCSAICWKNGIEGAGSGPWFFDCDQTYNCEAQCICGVCLET